MLGTTKTVGVRLVTFDLLHTLIAPQAPVHVLYARAFEPLLGPLDHDRIKDSFQIALRAVQKERASYKGGNNAWWGEVIKRTALGAGGDPDKVENSLPKIVPSLLRKFSSSGGYVAFGDAISTCEGFEDRKLKIAILSNTDSRIRKDPSPLNNYQVIDALGIKRYVDWTGLSAEMKTEKPNAEMFTRAIARMSRFADQPLELSECLHIGDELENDYHGPKRVGMRALLLRRPGYDNNNSNGYLKPNHDANIFRLRGYI
ncbi:hypothetical protein PLEOSDRAFT_50883 [Pleurotus ostreatus PC15]|uniref:Uncharacterized protein n=1 Tax=Pleurotus ostreatus (strain PC15) TaxID=1137138 RepID=A0A067NJK0_PLEO1|nr:hypothetical protein PLEOSDRAFT_50883 [Pleurotus ostreatus PC15]